MSSQSPAAPTPWGLVVLLASLTALAPVGIDLYLPSLPTIGRELNASDSQMQTTVATFLAGMAIGQFFYGPASDRIGRRAPILLGVGIFTVASVACALATSAPMLIASRFLQALGGCAGPVVARAMVRDRFGHVDTARVLSLMMLIMGLAPILAPLVGGGLLALGGWRLNFWAIAGYGAATWLAVLFMLKESRSAETEAHARGEHPFRTYLALLREPRLMGYAMAGALNGAALFTYISCSPGLLIGTYGISPANFGLVFGINAVGIIGSGQINRLMLRWITPDQVLARMSMVALVVAALLSLAAFTGAGGRWTVLPLLFLLLASYGTMQGNTMAGALNVDPRRAGAISALCGGASFAVGATASALAGAFHDGTARPMALTMLLLMIGSASALFGLALRKSAQT